MPYSIAKFVYLAFFALLVAPFPVLSRDLADEQDELKRRGGPPPDPPPEPKLPEGSDKLDVVELGESNYKRLVEQDDLVWIVKFSSGKCSSCRAFKPTFYEMLKKVSGYHVGHVDVDHFDGMTLARRLDVLRHGVPGVYLVHTKDNELVKLMAGEMGSADQLLRKLKSVSTEERRAKKGDFFQKHTEL